MSKSSEIKININLDENHIPETLTWTALDGGVEQEEAKTILYNASLIKARLEAM